MSANQPQRSDPTPATSSRPARSGRRRMVVAASILGSAALVFSACSSSKSSTTTSTSSAPKPDAEFVQLNGVSTTVDLDAGTVKVLTDNHVSVAPVAPAIAAVNNGVTSVSFPISEGFVSLYPKADAPFIRGLVSHVGGVTFSAGGKSLTATDFIVNPGTSVLTATVGDQSVPLLDLDGSNVAITKDAQGMVHLDGTVAKLSSTAASALNTTFGVTLFKQGIPLGVVHIVASGTAGPGLAATSQVQQLSGTSTAVDVDASTAKVLQDNGVTVSPVAPATAATANGALTVTFPITNGYVATYPKSQAPYIRGLVSHDGGLKFSAGGKSITATDFIVNPGTSVLTATVGGKAVHLLDLDGTNLQVTTDSAGAIHLDGTVASLSADAATALNSTFGVTLFKQGIPLGVVHLTATAAQ
jgi:hypothetical protein